MRGSLVIVVSSLIGALILGTVGAVVSIMTFYDTLFGLGHTDHERGIAWFLVGISTTIPAGLVLAAGAIYWIVTLCYRGVIKLRRGR